MNLVNKNYKSIVVLKDDTNRLLLQSFLHLQGMLRNERLQRVYARLFSFTLLLTH